MRLHFDKLEEYNPKRPKVAAPKWPGQINTRLSKLGLGTLQIESIPGVLG